MPEPDLTKIQAFSSAQDLGLWLEEHQATENELWVKIYKKSSGVVSVTWDDVVIESLCWGWIDGIKKSLNAEAYLQRITPRKARSSWSKRNTEHVERLLSEGRMQPSGLIQVDAAKSDGRWESAYIVSEMEVPADFLNTLEAHPEAKRFYETLTKSSRYVIAHGLMSAKKTETRKRRFDKYVAMLTCGDKPS